MILIFAKDHVQSGSNILLGDLMVMLNAISYAFYLVLVRPLMAIYSPIHVLRWVFSFGAMMMLPICASTFANTDWSLFGYTHWIALSFVALGATFLAYLLNVFGISTLGSSATGAYIYTQPIFTAWIAMAFAGEHFSWIKGLAALLIFSGVFLANYKKATD